MKGCIVRVQGLEALLAMHKRNIVEDLRCSLVVQVGVMSGFRA